MILPGFYSSEPIRQAHPVDKDLIHGLFLQAQLPKE